MYYSCSHHQQSINLIELFDEWRSLVFGFVAALMRQAIDSI